MRGVVIIALAFEAELRRVRCYDLVVGVDGVIEAVEGVCPGCFEDGAGPDGVGLYGFSKHGVLEVVGDFHRAGSNCKVLVCMLLEIEIETGPGGNEGATYEASAYPNSS